MKTSMKTNHAAYLSLSKAVEAIDTQAAFLGAALADLFDENGENFDLIAAGAVLTRLEGLVYQLRVAMFTAQNSDLPDDDGALMDDIIDLAIDICGMRDDLMDFLDDVFAEADDVFNEAIAEAEEADCFFVRVPAGSEIEIDGESYDFYECADEDGVIMVPVEPGEELTVDGEAVDLEGCVSGEVYSIIDGEGNEEDDEACGELADDEFLVWIPGGAVYVNGVPVEFDEDNLNEDGSVCLVLCGGDSLSVDGQDVDISDCKPGVEYDLTAA